MVEDVSSQKKKSWRWIFFRSLKNIFVGIGIVTTLLLIVLFTFPLHSTRPKTPDAIIQSSMASLRAYAETYQATHGSYTGLNDNNEGRYSDPEVEKIDDSIDRTLEAQSQSKLDPPSPNLSCNIDSLGIQYACSAPLATSFKKENFFSQGKHIQWFCIDSALNAKIINVALGSGVTVCP